ncbi:glutamine--fructose-6-phosphate transaminase (isomerizing) [Candidatus Venteria ishoeyi]|uniref:Glutamine--fructose-6-phosphate aminotransferase [isomerizing] n=1 Tax=Candidatus Venteria ishoeyi TaxID=1899563 RepID=A0A1H6FAZ8_9GAMM|nr:glutamine--fructose-6-phosphate transaminase (isomerizing) [Candidatus Venteria ishoeyi]SEH06551.1 Glutamine--fructose-6-phosphate aminotransferase [isomerizing] [Candidatus Venteria ishoeyi]
MCGIVGAVAERDVVPILLEGLRRLEYRGYDSAGLAVISEGQLQRQRVSGKVQGLSDVLQKQPLRASTGIAHTRWATHGKPSNANAHPHIAQSIAVVHNGIIENYRELRAQQQAHGVVFTSETDTEVIVHQIHYYSQQGQDLLQAVQSTLQDLEGAYALGVISQEEPGRLIATRCGSPLVIGVGIGEHFIASDVAALLPVTQRVLFLEEGDIADIQQNDFVLYDAAGQNISRKIHTSTLQADAVERGEYRHYMLKEIYEQSRAAADTLDGRLSQDHVLEAALGPQAEKLLENIQAIQIIACGTSYHAGMVARYWLESIAKIPCNVEVASEFRYRNPLASPNTLVVTISQSGETADTLAALKETQRLGFGPSLSICNVPESALVRASDLVLMTRAGPEIGVASTKAFTTQLIALLLLTLIIAKRRGLEAAEETRIVHNLQQLPTLINHALQLDERIEALAEQFADKHHALFLGRGIHYPIAMEGALKLKEISYIHAEAYPAGELKHGPLALVDNNMPVVAVAPNDALQAKLKSNLQEVEARGGEMLIFANHQGFLENLENVQVIELGEIDDIISPIIYTIPLQLLSYHVALIKGTDVDQPRNLAKSVTVE